ncbi:kinase-like domain-containing protein [Trichoderma pleuroticola]
MEAAPANPDNSCDDDYELPAAYLRLEQEIFRIGRDPDANSFSIQTDSESLVSRNHCEIYVIVYEASVNHVYVRDRKSVNGTFVNGRIIGVGPQISSGYLLQDGDSIEIRPHWKFIFYQPRTPPPRPLTAIQKDECRVFENEYIISPRCLGTGAEGAVYLATDSKTKRQLVCKLVNLGRQDGKMPREELYRKLQEIDVLRQLKHPNILPYIDAVISPHSLYIFTELASGGDLVSFINRHEFIQELDCRIILRQVVRGLAYLHRKGIIHRDLKPENILLAYSPKIAYHRIMLSDFGACAVPRRSRMVTDIGTFEYKAPELFSAGEAQTTAVDLWSLGVVSLRLLTLETESFENLTRMDQQSLEQMVRAMIKQVSPKHSSNSQRFTLACLQLTPVNRITAAEAECHDWFCTPQKHFEFFQQLDKRCLSDLADDAQLKPMPWDLASLQSPPLPSAPTKLSTTSAHKSVRWSSPPCTDTSGYFRDFQQDMKAARVGPLPGLPSPLHESGVLICRPKLAKESPDMTRKEEQNQGTPLRDRHSEDCKPENRIMTPHQLRVCDVLQLPLPGLDRHLKPPHSKTHRQDVLAELKRLDANFLTDTMQAPMENGNTGGEERKGLAPAGKTQQSPQ